VTYSPLDYLALFFISALIVGFLTPKIRNFAIKHEIFDAPNSDHKTHNEPVPYLGGIAIIIGVLVVTLSATLTADSDQIATVLAVLIPCLFLGFVGLIDDLVNLKPWPRFLSQTAVGIAVAITLIKTNTVGSPTGSRGLDIALTILFIVGLSNSVNFFDNVDGGASGTVAISASFLALLSYVSGQYYIAAISTVIAGATIGFLRWNRSPARIYMGDAGSLFLGSLMASILVRFDPNPITYPTFFFVPLFLIAIPLLDTTAVIISRIFRGVSPFTGGRDHLSHRLMRTGLSKVKAVSVLWGFTILFALLALLLSNVSHRWEPRVTLLGSTIWIVMLFLFLRIPATDKQELSN
jgi:UDP-GlcNAc:undecaprenyl-phosphate/decaprenyl-phosphate GlcNAc-1-phosphate transferase